MTWIVRTLARNLKQSEVENSKSTVVEQWRITAWSRDIRVVFALPALVARSSSSKAEGTATSRTSDLFNGILTCYSAFSFASAYIMQYIASAYIMQYVHHAIQYRHFHQHVLALSSRETWSSKFWKQVDQRNPHQKPPPLWFLCWVVTKSSAAGGRFEEDPNWRTTPKIDQFWGWFFMGVRGYRDTLPPENFLETGFRRLCPSLV